MNKFKYKVELVVEVEAFDAEDAKESLTDSFGIGENGNITVTEHESYKVI